MGKIPLKVHTDSSPFRKIAMGTWKNAADPTVYGLLELDVEDVLKELESYNQKHNIKATLNHVIGFAMARCLTIRPEINGFIRGAKIYLRQSVKLFFQVNIPGSGTGNEIKKATLSGCSIDHAEKMSIRDLATEMKKKVELIRSHKDPELTKNLAMFNYLPWCLSRWHLNLASFLIYGLNLNLKWLGIPQDPFGSIMITNIGSLGIDVAWAPLVPYSRVPLLLTLGAVQKKPWVIDNQVVVRSVLQIGVTFDHRFIDGIHAAQMAKELKKYFAAPKEHLFHL